MAHKIKIQSVPGIRVNVDGRRVDILYPAATTPVAPPAPPAQTPSAPVDINVVINATTNIILAMINAFGPAKQAGASATTNQIPIAATDTQEDRYAVIAKVRREMNLADNDHENQRLSGINPFSEGQVRVSLKTIEAEKAAKAAAVKPTPGPAPSPAVNRTATVEDLRKEILVNRPISDEFHTHLQTFATEQEARAKLLEYRSANEAIAAIDTARGSRPYWQEVNRLANEVVMGRMTMEQAKTERQKAAPSPAPKTPNLTHIPATGGATAAASAKAGLLAGLTGKGAI